MQCKYILPTRDLAIISTKKKSGQKIKKKIAYGSACEESVITLPAELSPILRNTFSFSEIISFFAFAKLASTIIAPRRSFALV